ncbi:MAG: DNA polymerase III subunit delta [Alphaproteobacteria bacterium]|nr:DNA polymerase III subunit delta [Alphaproteobacteria bacterium]
MKANKGQIERALDAPPADIRLFLLYGPDEAGSRALAKRLERAMGLNAERIDLDGPTLKADPARLADEAASISLFGDARWLRLTLSGEEALPAIEGLLNAAQAGNPVVALAGELRNTSKILKLALDHKAVMACASYVPEGRDAEQLAAAIARELGLRLPSDLARRIAELTGGDRTLMSGEIEKLALYLDAAPERPTDATHDAIDALAVEAAEQDIGTLVNATLGGDPVKLIHELQILAQLGASEGSMLWALLRRAHLLAALRAEMVKGIGLDAAMASAGRAVFWKDKGAVQRQVRLWSADGIARVIHRLGQAERLSRSSRNAGPILIEHELLIIARQAARGQ